MRASATWRTAAGEASNRCGSWSGLFRMLTTSTAPPADLARDPAIDVLRRHQRERDGGRHARYPQRQGGG